MKRIFFKTNNFFKAIIHKWLFTYDYDIVLQDGAKIPTRVYPNDAGYDLYLCKGITVKAKESCDLPTGVMMRNHIPSWLLMTGRSSTIIRYKLHVVMGIIDGDYVGELHLQVTNLSNKDVVFPPHFRVGQIIAMPHTTIRFHQKEKLKIKGRGQNGFGHTGH